ncbi:MAG: glycosyltransferase family 2 protein [Thermodesulfobacteriota bacterium]
MNDQSQISPELSIFVPCLNEEANVNSTLRTILEACAEVGCSYEILVVDDGSTDATSQRVEEFKQEHPKEDITLVRGKSCRGLAHRYRQAAQLARGKYFRLVCGDNVEPRETMVAIFSKRGLADVVVPYPEDIEGLGLGRRTLRVFFNSCVNLASGNKLKYYNGCHLHLRENVINSEVDTKGFGFQAEILCHLLAKGATFQEVPVKFRHNQDGPSGALKIKNMAAMAASVLRILRGRFGGVRNGHRPR